MKINCTKIFEVNPIDDGLIQIEIGLPDYDFLDQIPNKEKLKNCSVGEVLKEFDFDELLEAIGESWILQHITGDDIVLENEIKEILKRRID